MDRRIDAHIARTQFGQIMNIAIKNNERFVVDHQRRAGRRHHERAGFHPYRRAAARLASESLGRRQAAAALTP